MEFLDAKALRHFLAVVRHGSFRGAAEHLNVAPSAVSRQMAELEQELGLPLFERTARGVTLTPAGTLLLEHGRRMGDAHGVLNAELDRLKGGEQRRIAIACGEGFVGDLVQNGIKPFMAIHPQLRHGLTLLGTDAILEAIANGEADIGIVYNPPVDTRMRSIAIKRQPLCIVACAGLFAPGPADLAACLRQPVALLTKGHGIRQLVARMAADAGLALQPVLETPSIEALRRFAICGAGASFLPHFAVADDVAAGHALTAQEIDHPLARQASAHLIVRAHRRLPASVEQLASHLAQHMAAFRL
ncbi:LysR family transcriptional regulator [Aureimonas frigidaquae]|uniref:LysR family transcriptional regulator n=1 Tax=Aureimonas frigidaquae TaxID=424757 RepID=UPI00078213AC|nr:LysR family transcriptional regulator [Aureimonas frigidaquae]